MEVTQCRCFSCRLALARGGKTYCKKISSPRKRPLMLEMNFKCKLRPQVNPFSFDLRTETERDKTRTEECRREESKGEREGEEEKNDTEKV